MKVYLVGPAVFISNVTGYAENRYIHFPFY